MGPIEIIVIIVAALIVLAVVGCAVRRKIKGKSGDCGCGCADCPGRSGCARNKTNICKKSRKKS